MMNRAEQNWPTDETHEITDNVISPASLARLGMYLVAIRCTDSVFPSVHESYGFLQLAEQEITRTLGGR